ncbi:MAG TPA: serine protease [Candidatus Saccharimonadales bacterium]
MPRATHESKPNTSRRRFAAASALAALSLTGCAAGALDPSPSPSPSSTSGNTRSKGNDVNKVHIEMDTSKQFPRCFKFPLADQPDQHGAVRVKPLRLPYNPAKKAISGGPNRLSEKIERKVQDAVIAVYRTDEDGNEFKGSGFLVRRGKNDVVAFTAAHVVMPGKMKDVRLIDNDKRSTRIEGGCYIYDRPGKRVRVEPLNAEPKPKPVGVDIAVMRMKKQIGDSVLQMADEKPKRGDFVYTINFQAESNPGSPSKYLGVVALTPPDRPLAVLTGIQPWVSESEADHTKALPGASGGVMVNQEGDVVGMIYAGHTNDNYREDDADFLTNRALRTQYGVTFPGIKSSADSGFQPSQALLIEDKALDKALESPKLS